MEPRLVGVAEIDEVAVAVTEHYTGASNVPRDVLFVFEVWVVGKIALAPVVVAAVHIVGTVEPIVAAAVGKFVAEVDTFVAVELVGILVEIVVVVVDTSLVVHVFRLAYFPAWFRRVVQNWSPFVRCDQHQCHFCSWDHQYCT